MRSGTSDHVVINNRCEEATWQPMERPIARRIRAVDLHLSEDEYVTTSDSSDCILISTVDQEVL